MENEKINIVASYTDTIPGKIIKLRAEAKFWNRYSGDTYSHVSLSRDSKLGNMMSFARKDINNPFDSGLIKEDIRSGMFALKKDVSRIAVMELKVTPEQYRSISKTMDRYWQERDKYGFNFAGLASMLIYAKGVAPKNKFFCSQWVDTVLLESGIDIFNGKKPHNIRPFDFYGALKDNIVYEGLATEYPEYLNDIANISSNNSNTYGYDDSASRNQKIYQYKQQNNSLSPNKKICQYK